MRRLDDLHLEAPFDAAWESWMDAAQRQVTDGEFRTERSTALGRKVELPVSENNCCSAALWAAPKSVECRKVVALAGVGLQGDRYANASVRRGPEYQVTLIEIENIEAFAKTASVLFTNDMPRRNLVTRGVSLNDLCGKRFKVGNATFDGLELCEPCALFASRTHRDVLKYFLRRGGLRARIVIGGEINVGDTVGLDY
jgi:MOSC domain-containing protein YiiM